MTINHLNIPRGGAYTAPSAEEIQMQTLSNVLVGSLDIPDVEEENLGWD